MAKQNNILVGLAGAAIGYWFGNRNKPTTAVDLVSERGDGNKITYPIYRIKGTTKTALTGSEYEDVLKNSSVAVTLVDMGFLNQYTTVGTIQTNNL